MPNKNKINELVLPFFFLIFHCYFHFCHFQIKLGMFLFLGLKLGVIVFFLDIFLKTINIHAP